MSAMTFSFGPELGDTHVSLEKLRAKFGPLAMVLAAHALLFYFIYSGMMSRMVDAAMPQAVLVTFVAPPPPPKAPPPAAPKLVPLAQLTPPVLPQVPVPVIQVAVQPVNTITVTQAAAPVANAPAPAVAVSAPAAAGPKTITSGIEYIQQPQLIYPSMSLKMGEQGKVVLRVLVNESGKATQVQVQTSSGFARIDEAGRQAALRALFKPFVEDGRAIAAYVLVPYTFSLPS